MKPQRLFLAVPLLVTVVLLADAEKTPATPPVATPASAAAPKPPPLSPRFQQVRNRIDDLFHNRLSTPPPIDPKQNPFRAPGAYVPPLPAAGEARANATPAEVQASDLTLLQQAVATLKVGGRFVSSGKEHRMINSRLYKEGDVIPAPLPGQTVYLKVKALTLKSLTLALNEQEMTLALQ